MNSTTFQRVIARANQELQKAGIITDTNFEQYTIKNIVNLHIDGEPSNQKSGWIIIFTTSDQLILTFGNFRTGQNFACYAAASKKLIGFIHIDLSKAILSARLQREKILNPTRVTRIKNNWNIYKIGEENV